MLTYYEQQNVLMKDFMLTFMKSLLLSRLLIEKVPLNQFRFTNNASEFL